MTIQNTKFCFKQMVISIECSIFQKVLPSERATINQYSQEKYCLVEPDTECAMLTSS